MTTPLLRCEALAVGYDGRAILDPIDLSLGQGEFWAVVGRNGSGKTTWFKTLLGLQPPVGGRIVRRDGLPIAYVPQRTAFDPLYPVPVHEVVSMGAERGWSFLTPFATHHDRVAEALDAVGAAHLTHRTFRSLSVGQQQRVLLARMIASDAKLALLDEPTAAMDAVAESEAMHLLDDLRKRFDLTVVVVSHHLAAAFAQAEHILFLDPDEGVVVGTPQEIRDSPAYEARYAGARQPECLDAPGGA